MIITKLKEKKKEKENNTKRLGLKPAGGWQQLSPAWGTSRSPADSISSHLSQDNSKLTTTLPVLQLLTDKPDISHHSETWEHSLYIATRTTLNEFLKHQPCISPGVCFRALYLELLTQISILCSTVPAVFSSFISYPTSAQPR